MRVTGPIQPSASLRTEQAAPAQAARRYTVDLDQAGRASAYEALDKRMLAEALRPRPTQHMRGSSPQRQAFNTAVMGTACLIGALCLLRGARAQSTSSTPTPTRTPTPGVIASGAGATYASWTFDDGFSASLTAFCKQVNPARGLLRKIQACGSNTAVGEAPAGIFVGGVGKPSDCPDANTADVYTAALYVSNVVRNSTAFQCLKGLVSNPVMGP